MSNIQTTVQGYPVSTTGPLVSKTVQAHSSLYRWCHDHAAAPDYWLRRVICEAFCRMLARRMQDAPAADVILVVAEDWIDIVGEGMVAELDLERIIAGFRRIFRECRRWPQPSELLKRLPNRPQRAKLAEPAPNDEQHQRSAAELQKIIDMFKGF